MNSRTDFKNFIESLYKIFYEGSGSLKRIPKDLLLEDSVFFDIKHIRTGIVHDVEHGKATDIQKKKQKIKNIYNKYSNKKALEEIAHPMLVHFQRKLVENIKRELENIKSRISS